MRISDWSSDVCSSDLEWRSPQLARGGMTTEVDYYERLGVERTADDKTLKTAYLRLAVQYHPYKNAGCQDMEAKFKAINEAYDCLKDPQKRAAYDRFGHEAFKNGGFNGNGQGAGGFSDLGDIF